MERQLPLGVAAIVTNPPFKNAGEFVAHALSLCPKVVMLLRLAFLESERRWRSREGHLVQVHVFRKAPVDDAPAAGRNVLKQQKASPNGLGCRAQRTS